MTGSTANTVKRIGIGELHLVAGLFNRYRMFYKQEDNISIAESFLTERLANKESVVFIVLANNGTPIGFTQLYPKYSSVTAVKNWILNDLYVDEQYRKQGIGAKLIETAMDFARADGSKFVQLETAVSNATAQSLYESIGFVKQQHDDEFYVYKINVN
ncbi:MAG: GNAT family N-acetyltransferase [Mucilaginibacter sp.]